MRKARHALLAAALPLSLLAACALSEQDLDAFRDTASGPAKIRAVLHDPTRPAALRAHAALSLLTLPRADSGGTSAMLSELRSLSDDDRAELTAPLLEDLARSMRAGAHDAPPADAVRAKDAAFELLPLVPDEARAKLGRNLLAWVLEDVPRRADAGAHALEQVAQALGPMAADSLLAGFTEEQLPTSVSRVARVVDRHAQPKTRKQAGERLVGLELRHRAPEHAALIARQIARELDATRGPSLSPELTQAQVESQRRTALAEHILPALGLFADQTHVRTRLVAMARDRAIDLASRTQALTLLAGKATELELSALLALALDDAEDASLRELAVERAGETGSAEALPALLSLLSDRSHEGLRKRAGVLVLSIGGPKVLPTFFRALPRQWAMRYSKAEMSAYSQQINTFAPEMAISMLLGEKLHSSHWWPRYLALHYFAARGAYEDIWRIRQHTQDTLPILGEGFPKGHTVGQEAEAAVTLLLDRLSAG